MPVSPSKRATNDRWDKANMATLACKIRKEEAELIRAKAEAEGLTVNALITRLLRDWAGISAPDTR